MAAVIDINRKRNRKSRRMQQTIASIPHNLIPIARAKLDELHHRLVHSRYTSRRSRSYSGITQGGLIPPGKIVICHQTIDRKGLS